MTLPIGCIMTGKNRVQGQCDAKACNHPFCEASEPAAYSTMGKLPVIPIRLGHESNADRDRGWYQ